MSQFINKEVKSMAGDPSKELAELISDQERRCCPIFERMWNIALSIIDGKPMQIQIRIDGKFSQIDIKLDQNIMYTTDVDMCEISHNESGAVRLDFALIIRAVSLLLGINMSILNNLEAISFRNENFEKGMFLTNLCQLSSCPFDPGIELKLRRFGRVFLVDFDPTPDNINGLEALTFEKENERFQMSLVEFIKALR